MNLTPTDNFELKTFAKGSSSYSSSLGERDNFRILEFCCNRVSGCLRAFTCFFPCLQSHNVGISETTISIKKPNTLAREENPYTEKDEVAAASESEVACSIEFDTGSRCSSAKCLHGFDDARQNSSKCFFNIKEKLGRGSYGEVFAGKCFKGCEVAIKRNFEWNKKGDIKNEIRNILVVSGSESKHIVEYFGCFKSNGEGFLVFELGDASLHDFLHHSDGKLKRKMEVAHFNNIAYQSLEIVDFLNRVKVFHNDFALRNIIYFSGDDKIKLTDFGNSFIPGDTGYPQLLLTQQKSDLCACLDMLFSVQLLFKNGGDSRVCEKTKKDKRVFMIEFNDLKNKREESIWLKGLSEDGKKIMSFYHKYDDEITDKEAEDVLSLRNQLVPIKQLTDSEVKLD